MSAQIRINGNVFDLDDGQTNRSLLQVLREDLQLTGTKEGCASGDCGACTVVANKPGGQVHTLNSCITPAGAYAGGSIATIEALAPDTAGSTSELHPIQRAMVEQHGAQCGFCTPGFIMSMFGAQLADADEPTPIPTPTQAQQQIGGNLCRCTGYRPILDALRDAWQAPERADHNAAFDWLTAPEALPSHAAAYHQPANLDELRRLLAATGSNRTIVAGSTDAWLASSQRYEDFPLIIDVSNISEMLQIAIDAEGIHIGAAVTHAMLERFFAREQPLPAMVQLLHRFGSRQIRARGTIGGNIANASPIADLPPLLMCLDAELELLSANGTSRRVQLDQFYLGYKQTLLQPNEIVTCIHLNTLPQAGHLFAFKISKREEDDISSVMGAFYLPVDDKGRIVQARVAYGGVAATPVRLTAVETELTGLHLDELTNATYEALNRQLEQLISPITDVRASAAYRTRMAQALLHKALQLAASRWNNISVLELHDVQ